MSLVTSNSERSQRRRCESEATKLTWSANRAHDAQLPSTTRFALHQTK